MKRTNTDVSASEGQIAELSEPADGGEAKEDIIEVDCLIDIKDFDLITSIDLYMP